METQFLEDDHDALLGQEDVDTEVQEGHEDLQLLRKLSTQRPILAHLEWRGQQFPIFRGDNLIGRDVVCEIRLDHKSISNKHAVIVAEETPVLRCEIRDLRSINGTFVELIPNSDQFMKLNVLKSNTRELSEGGKVRFGMVSCLLRAVQAAATASTTMQETQFLGGFDASEDEEDEEEVAEAKVPGPITNASSSSKKKRFLDDDDDTVTDEELAQRPLNNFESDTEDEDGFDPYDIPKASSVFLRVGGNAGEHKAATTSAELPTQIDADFPAAARMLPSVAAMDTADEDEEDTMSQDLMEPIDEEAPVANNNSSSSSSSHVKEPVEAETPPMSPHVADVTLDGNDDTATESEGEAEVANNTTTTVARKSTLLDTTMVSTQHTASPSTPANPAKQSHATPSPMPVLPTPQQLEKEEEVKAETEEEGEETKPTVGRRASSSSSSSSSARKGRTPKSVVTEVVVEAAPSPVEVAKKETIMEATPVQAAEMEVVPAEPHASSSKGRKSLKFTESVDERYQEREAERLEAERLAEEAAAKKSSRGRKKTEKAAEMEEKVQPKVEAPATASKAKRGKKAVEEEVEVPAVTEAEVKEEKEVVVEKPSKGGKKRKAADVIKEEEPEEKDVAHVDAPSSSSSSSKPAAKRARGGKAVEEDTAVDAAVGKAPEVFKIKLLFTKLDEADYVKHLKKIPDVEVTSDPTLATYCITTKELKRTPKLLVSLNSHVRYILHDQWILDSAKQGRAMPIVDDETKYHFEGSQQDPKLADAYKRQLQKSTYIIRDEEKEKLWDFDMVETLTKIRIATNLQGERQLPGVFKGLAVFCSKGLCGSKAPSEEETQQLIEAGGGLWLKNIQDFPGRGGADGKKKGKGKKDDAVDAEVVEERKLIIVSHESLAKKEIKKDMIELAKQSGAKGIYSVEVIFIAILKQALDLDNFFIEGYKF